MKWEIDLITPVPLGLARLAERGYNQSSLLARPLSLALHVPYRPQILSRVRETRSQVGLTAAERRENVSGAFVARSNGIMGRNVLLVDDVTTSGSTLDACAEALFTAGARQVYGLTLARAVLKAPLLSDQPILES
jgi:ComF family protein